MITTVAIRLALRKVAEITCGIDPTLIRVMARQGNLDRNYVASNAWEYRDEVFSYLKQHVDFEIRVEEALLYLTEEQAGAVLAVALGTTPNPMANHARIADIE